jgi:FkbM family methyltransferase
MRFLSHARQLVRKIVHLLSTLGVRGAVAYVARRESRDPETGERRIILRARHVRYPLVCRAGTSDINVFRQIFIKSEYSPLDDAADVRLIIDCGANVGFSSAYFLSRFPDAELIAVEPDAGNFLALERNVRPYGKRVTLLHAGIWTHEAALVMSDEPFRDGFEWTRQVREALPEEAVTVPGVDIRTLLDRSGHERISLLKIDIEGAEALIFDDERRRLWIDRVDNLVIELHDDSQFGDATVAFGRAIRELHLACTRHGPDQSIVVCRGATSVGRS